MPLPPTKLLIRGQLADNMSSVLFSWQPPLGLIINTSIIYYINFSISIQNFTYDILDMTDNLTYVYYYDTEEQCEDIILYVNVSVYAENRVGRGDETRKELLLNDNQCITPNITTCGTYLIILATFALSQSQSLCLYIF